MRKQTGGNALGKAGLTAMIWTLAFQSPLESVWGPFSYIDEVVALIGACLGLYDIVIVRKGHPSKDQLWMGVPLLVFVAVGLTGNLIYQYQPLKCVIIDLYTNLKFFFAIGTGYYLFASMDWEEIKKIARGNAQLITGVLFALFLVDRFFHFWPAEVRYGIPSAKLFYYHPTYLAGAMAFLLVLLTAFYEKKNIPFVLLGVVIILFTMRSKAMTSAVLFVGLFTFLVILKQKIYLWHLLAFGIIGIVLGWSKINYYFVQLWGNSARSVMLATSFLIMRDYFPIGTGFGTYGSAEAAKHYSPVYLKYGFNDNLQLRDINNFENTQRLIEIYGEQFNTPQHINGVFLNDSFWPLIFGQMGVSGTIVYFFLLGRLFKKCWALQKTSVPAYAAVMYVWVHLGIASIAEPAFNNSTAIPLAMVMGIVLCAADKQRLSRNQKKEYL